MKFNKGIMPSGMEHIFAVTVIPKLYNVPVISHPLTKCTLHLPDKDNLIAFFEVHVRIFKHNND